MSVLQLDVLRKKWKTPSFSQFDTCSHIAYIRCKGALVAYHFAQSGIDATQGQSWKKNPVCKSLSQKQIMWFPSGGLHIYVSALDSELFEPELVASTSELLSATSYP